MVDLHSHVLPSMDDGAKDVAEAVKLIGLEQENGVRTVAATPHFHFEDGRSVGEFLQERERAAAALSEGLTQNSSAVEFIYGAEVYLSPEILRSQDNLSLCYTGTQYMLVELPMTGFRDWIPEALYHLRLEGITPVIAHVERYPYLQKKPDILYELVNAGSIAQVNASSIARQGESAKLIAKFFESNLAHVVASDTHSVDQRPPQLSRAMKLIASRFGRDFADALSENSVSIAANKALDLPEPMKVKKKFFLFR